MGLLILVGILSLQTRMYVGQNCSCRTFFPHGNSANDYFIHFDDVQVTETVSVPFVFYGTSYYEAYLSDKGMITFGSGYLNYNTQCGYPLNTGHIPYDAIFIYWMDLDGRNQGHISFRVDDGTDLLSSIDTIIQGCTGDVTFTSNTSLVATWYGVQETSITPGTEFTFQATIATNGVDTYMITSYEHLTNSFYIAGIGGQNANRTKGYNHPYSCYTDTDLILTSSNFGCPGQYIVKISDDNPTYGTLENGTLVCQSNPCENGAPCVDTIFGYTCVCVDGFGGQNCEIDIIYKCSSSPCKNNATCHDTDGNYTCLCLDGFTGLDCETDIDDCISDPCDNNATCVNGVNIYACICLDGFTGQRCETDKDDCLLYPCENNATCVDAVNSYSCICVDGFTGGDCETDIDDCVSDHCEHNATCVDDIDNFTCNCVDGFTGQNCETDIDNCVSGPCENNATCVDATDNFTCNCVDGFTGRNCETDINECKSQPCQNGATCNDDINSYRCQCKEGWSGTHCEIDVDECLSGPCKNGGSCQNIPGSFKCTCTKEWAGTKCQIRLEFDPEVTSAYPNKGPVAGGTRITVRGDYLPASDPIFVHLGTLDCVTIQQNKTTVLALSPTVNESDTALVDVNLPMSVELSGGKVFNLKETFLYKGNPKIESFKPKDTIVTGGTQITVSGEDLDAVAAPAVKIIVTYYKAISKDPIEYNVTSKSYEAPCEVKDVSEMQCQTPQIELPEDFKIDQESDSDNDGESRRKRSNENIEFQDGDDRLTFHVGFALDGVTEFENFSSINVHPEPIFNFDYGDGNNAFHYKQGERLRFAGDSLDAGIMESDYRIDIGKAVCGSVELLSNSLSCAPPDDKPQLDPSNPDPNPKIIINVGLNVQHFAGYLEYPDTEQLYIVIPASILSVIVIITIILTVCLLRRNHKKGQRENQQG